MVMCQREPENGSPGSMYVCPPPPMSLHALLAASHLHLQGAGTTGLSGGGRVLWVVLHAWGRAHVVHGACANRLLGVMW